MPALDQAAKRCGLTLRQEEDADAPFLERLYIAGRWNEPGVNQWPEPVRLAFLQQQGALRRAHYDACYRATADFLILESAHTAVGRLCLQRAAGDIRVVDISLMPDWQGRGCGTRLLQAVIDEARLTGRTVSLQVELSNPAMRLYQRLGFAAVSSDGAYATLTWRAQSGCLQT